MPLILSDPDSFTVPDLQGHAWATFTEEGDLGPRSQRSRESLMSTHRLPTSPLSSHLPYTLLRVFPSWEWTQSNYWNWLHRCDSKGPWGSVCESSQGNGSPCVPRQLAGRALATATKPGASVPIETDQGPQGWIRSWEAHATALTRQRRPEHQF